MGFWVNKNCKQWWAGPRTIAHPGVQRMSMWLPVSTMWSESWLITNSIGWSIWRLEFTKEMLRKSNYDCHLSAVGGNWHVVMFWAGVWSNMWNLWLVHLHRSYNNFLFRGSGSLPLHRHPMRTYNLHHHKGVKDFLTKSEVDLVNLLAGVDSSRETCHFLLPLEGAMTVTVDSEGTRLSGKNQSPK